jgi:predicted RND superfamily exporter protein
MANSGIDEPPGKDIPNVLPVAAFGTFIISESPSLIRFGSQASLALAGCLIVTLILLPSIARLFLTPDQHASSEGTR